MDSQTSQPALRRLDSKQKSRQAGIALSEVFVTILTLVASVAVIDWFPGSGDRAVSSRGTRAQAVAIAQGQMTVMRGLPYRAVRPTPGFTPASWVGRPGYATGDVHVQIENRTNGTLLEDEIYHVSWNVSARDASQSMMDVTVRVSWTGADGGPMRHVDLEGWRAR